MGRGRRPTTRDVGQEPRWPDDLPFVVEVGAGHGGVAKNRRGGSRFLESMEPQALLARGASRRARAKAPTVGRAHRHSASPEKRKCPTSSRVSVPSSPKSPSNAPASPLDRGIVAVEAPFVALRPPFFALRLPRIAIEAPFLAIEGRFFALRARFFDLERRAGCGNVGTRAPWVRLPRSRRVGRAHRRNVGLLRGRARAALATARASLRSPPECSGVSYLVSPFVFLRGVESTSASGSIALASLPSFFARTLATP